MSLMVVAAHANADLNAAIENVRTACGNISTELNDMKKMAEFAVENFGEYGGIAQQYLFYYITHNNKE